MRVAIIALLRGCIKNLRAMGMLDGTPTAPLLLATPEEPPVIWAPDGEVFTLGSQVKDHPNASVQGSDSWFAVSQSGPRIIRRGQSSKFVRVPSMGGREAHP